MLVNLTPHAITLRSESGDTTIAASGSVARVSTAPGVVICEAGGVPVYSADSIGNITGLPQPSLGTLYIVSQMVAARVPDRADVVYPGTGPNHAAIRDSEGRIVAVTRLISAAQGVTDVCPYCEHDNGPVSPLTGRGAHRLGWDCEQCGGN